jgi:hypothetical protein
MLADAANVTAGSPDGVASLTVLKPITSIHTARVDEHRSLTDRRSANDTTDKNRPTCRTDGN